MNEIYRCKVTGEYWSFLGKKDLGIPLTIYNVYESMDGKSRRYIPEGDPINADMEPVGSKKDLT